MSGDEALWFGIKALAGYGEDTAAIWERLEDLLGTEGAGAIVAALCQLGEDEIKEGNR